MAARKRQSAIGVREDVSSTTVTWEWLEKWRQDNGNELSMEDAIRGGFIAGAIEGQIRCGWFTNSDIHKAFQNEDEQDDRLVASYK